ncbi:DNA polymerase III alpha subunit [Vibrio sp. JCM 19236]|nr:DNA polymerase III alpha subunit [Vibrio sp. JCM 19236]
MDSSSDLPLFRDVQDSSEEYPFAINEYDELVEDYSATGLSLNQHPITLLDKAGRLGRFTRQRIYNRSDITAW